MTANLIYNEHMKNLFHSRQDRKTTTRQNLGFTVNPIEGDSERFISYVVMDMKGIPERPEFRIDFTDPNNRSYLERYILNDRLTVQLRETHVFRSIPADRARSVAKSHPDSLFRFIDDADSVTYQTSEWLIEMLDWQELHHEGDSNGYSFFLDRILSIEDRNKILMGIGFSQNELFH